MSRTKVYLVMLLYFLNFLIHSINQLRMSFSNVRPLIVYIYNMIVLTDFGIDYEVDPTLVRGLDYYNGICFEFKVDNSS